MQTLGQQVIKDDHVIISNPDTIAKLNGQWQPKEHVTPHSLVMIPMHFCDYSGPTNEEESCYTVILPGLMNMGIICTKQWRPQALQDALAYCLAHHHYVINESDLAVLGLGGPLNVRRSSGTIEYNWGIDTRPWCDGHYTVFEEGELYIHMYRNEGHIGKYIPLAHVCAQCDCDVPTVTARLQAATARFFQENT
jgi:hypothetical protein